MTPGSQTTLNASDFTLVDHERSVARLHAIMRRVGAAAMSEEEFILAVSVAYYEVEAARHARYIHEYFHRCDGYGHFKRSLIAARHILPRPVSVLDIGCGAGYEMGVLREVFAPSEIERIVGLDPSAKMMEHARAALNGFSCQMVLGTLADVLDQGPFHLVVTHAMVHHIPNLAWFFGGIERLLAPGGVYVMGHEPNRRFWTNLAQMPKLRQVHAAERRRRQLRKLFQPSRYLGKVARLLGLIECSSCEAAINRILRQRHGFTTDLTPREIHRLVDVHVPDYSPGDFCIGMEGFDWDELAATMLSGLELKSLVTYGYTRRSSGPEYWPPCCPDLDAELAATHPLDGICFTAVWQKRETR